MSKLSNLWHALQPFWIDKALQSIEQADYGYLVKMLITLEPHIIRFS